MANNRMVLICNVCILKGKEWKYGEKGVLAIAKWYPVGGFIAGEDGSYYANDGIDGKRIDKFLFDHQHKEIASENYKAGAGQENPIRIEYESDGMPKNKTNPPQKLII